MPWSPMGASSSNRARYAVRLIRYRHRGLWYSYLTNVLDPLQLPAAEVVRLYARRWDIELAFRLLKDHLCLNLIWSAKWEVIGAQIWACLTLAQLFHALQMQAAEQADVDPFEISMHLLVRHVPRWLACGLSPLQQILQHGRDMGLIRPSTRLLPRLPAVSLSDLRFPDPDLSLERPARYSHRPAGNRSRKKPPS
ncbi:MAG TPA: transposase [Ktedonosporobacter sp.]|nr:transposase [Ktedonosporobacter sp.]